MSGLDLSLGIPALIAIFCRNVLPEAGSGSRPRSNALRSIPRRTALDWMMSTTLRSLSSSSASTVIDVASLSIDAMECLKSKRPAISLRAWLSALSSSCGSTRETTSNEKSAMRCLQGVALLDDVALFAHRRRRAAVQPHGDAPGVTRPHIGDLAAERAGRTGGVEPLHYG